jgi:predicted helicase
MAPDIELRPHQKEAVAAAATTLRHHTRASVIAACGTGKTLIAARTTARIAPRDRVLVLLPTLDLLSQTIRSWRAAGRRGSSIAVCSARQALDHEPLGTDIPLTTDPGELTALTASPRSGPVTAYATYASPPWSQPTATTAFLPGTWWSSMRLTAPPAVSARLGPLSTTTTRSLPPVVFT